MTLLADLLSQRDHWLVPTSPSGNSDHPDLDVIKVERGANPPYMERWFASMEATMIAVLSSRDRR
jgi:hypothetical protein